MRVSALQPLNARAVFICLALGATSADLVMTAHSEEGSPRWSAANRDQAIDAAVTTAEMYPDAVTQAQKLLELAIDLKGADGHRLSEIKKRIHLLLPQVTGAPPLESIVIVRKLVELGDDEGAERFVLAQRSEFASSFWKELARARASVGNYTGAESAASQVDEPIERLGALRTLAKALCNEQQHPNKHKAWGKSVVQSMEGLARPLLADPTHHIKGPILVVTAAAIASCAGRDAVVIFLKNSVPDTEVRRILEQVSPDVEATPINAEEALLQAHRLLLRHEVDAARIALRRAVEMRSDHSWHASDLRNHIVFSLLIKSHLYDDAMILLPPAKACWLRAQYYRELIRAAAADKVLRIVDAVLRDAVDCKLRHLQKRRHNETRSYLATLVVALARAGLIERARIPYAALSNVEPEPAGVPDPTVIEARIAMGDGAQACKEYDEAGEMTHAPEWSRPFVATIMQGDAYKSSPSGEVLLERMKRAKAALPAALPGPRASFLQCSVDTLVEAGNTDAALEIANELDVEPREALERPRNAAFAAIARAFHEAGDPAGELSVALKMDAPRNRWPVLLRLSTLQAQP
jgi:hypothetical protein